MLIKSNINQNDINERQKYFKLHIYVFKENDIQLIQYQLLFDEKCTV
jgi:hypothetical protein